MFVDKYLCSYCDHKIVKIVIINRNLPWVLWSDLDVARQDRLLVMKINSSASSHGKSLIMSFTKHMYCHHLSSLDMQFGVNTAL